MDANQYMNPMLTPMGMGVGMGMPRFPSPGGRVEMKPKRRPYTHLACSQCKDKHQKCDGQKPVCTTCAMKQIECTYRQERNKRKDGEYGSTQEEAAYLRAEIYQWRERYDTLKKFVDENLFPFCAVNGGMLSSLPIDNSIDKQLYQLQQEQLQLPQDPLQQQHPQLQQLQQLQLQQIQQLQLQLLQQNEPEPLIPNPSLLGSEELSQNMLLSNSNLFSPHLAQYPFSAGFPYTSMLPPPTELGSTKSKLEGETNEMANYPFMQLYEHEEKTEAGNGLNNNGRGVVVGNMIPSPLSNPYQ